MDKVTLTPCGVTFMQQNFSTNHLPSLNRHASNQSQNITISKHPSRGKLGAASLRNILKDDTITEVNRLKEQTNTRAYLHVKQELMKGIDNNNGFLGSKASNMARKMLAEGCPGQNMQTELSKGRNYLSKILGEYEVQREGDEKMRARLRDKSRGAL